jgi:hypothetical protein
MTEMCVNVGLIPYLMQFTKKKLEEKEMKDL